MEARLESASDCCVHSRQPSLIGLNCHTMPCKRRNKAPHRTSINESAATDINCCVSRSIKYTTSHWPTLVTLYVILLFNVCNGLVVSKHFLNRGKICLLCHAFFFCLASFFKKKTVFVQLYGF